MTPADGGAAGDWIEWSGGECPVPLSTKIDMRLGAPHGGVLYGYSAGLLANIDPNWSNWRQRGYNDIIAYRVVQP